MSVAFICVSLLSFFWTLITSSRIYFDPTSEGFKQFINYYQPQIALAGVGMVLFALWITSERMIQTQDQIKSITDNNRYNNFIKHRESFFDFMEENDFLRNMARRDSRDSKFFIGALYNSFYYSSYHFFEPNINPSIGSYLIIIRDKLLSYVNDGNVDLNNADINELEGKLSLFRFFNYDDIIEELSEKPIPNLLSNLNKRTKIQLMLYYHLKFLSLVWAFEADDDTEILNAIRRLKHFINSNGVHNSSLN